MKISLGYHVTVVNKLVNNSKRTLFVGLHWFRNKYLSTSIHKFIISSTYTINNTLRLTTLPMEINKSITIN